MPDPFYLISKWWKHLLAIVLLSLTIAGVTYNLQRKKYMSVSTALPANSFLADKGKIFNENIQALYSALGTSDELDMIAGTGQLDTVYLAVTDEFNLFDHYKVSEQGDEARIKAAYLLKKNSRVIKSEYGALKVKVWDTDKDLAPQLANSIMNNIQQIHIDLQNANNQSMLATLTSGKRKLQTQLDSLPNLATNEMSRKNLENQLERYETMIGQYQLMLDSKTLSLLIVEPARKSSWPDRPKLWTVLLATGVLSLLFGLLVALLLEKKKTVQS
jgi:hypothetical protein